jgi:DNA polymerase I-like protein with 3'-5' exonuclease and polymerase domains
VASDLCLEALVRITARQDEFGGHVLFAVHDSVALEVPKKQINKAARIIREEFEQNLTIDTTGIPFPCDIEYGPNWGVMEKVKDGGRYGLTQRGGSIARDDTTARSEGQ